MLHFETIWNQAESVAKSFTDLSRKEILGHVRDGVDNLADSDSIAEYNEALGDILFGLCELCAHLEEKKSLQLNSAAALTQAIVKNRLKLVGVTCEACNGKGRFGGLSDCPYCNGSSKG